MTKLKPCPFCGCNEITLGHIAWDAGICKSPAIVCEGCGVTTAHQDLDYANDSDYSDLIEQWNDRV